MEGVHQAGGVFAGQRAEENANDKRELGEAELVRVFKSFDTDASGHIDANELKDALMMLGVRCTIGSARSVLNVIDSNKNGQIELDEFIEFFRLVGDPSEIKSLLSKAHSEYIDDKMMVQEDPSFGNRFHLPQVLEPARKLAVHEESVEDSAWIPKTDQFVSCGLDGNMYIYDVTNDDAKVHHQIHASHGFYSVTAARCGNKLLTGLSGKSDNLRMWNIADLAAGGTSGEESVVQRYEGHDAGVYCVDVEDLQMVSGAQNGRVVLHEMEKNTAILSGQYHEGVVFSVQFKPQDATLIMTAGADGQVQMKDVRTRSQLLDAGVIADASSAGVVYSAQWRGEHEVVSCGDDFTIKRWDVRALRKGPVCAYLGHTAPVRSIALSPCGNYLVSGTQDGSIRLWLVDELGAIRRVRDGLVGSIDKLGKRQAAMEELLGEDISAVDPADFKAVKAEREAAKQKLASYRGVLHEREESSSTQARHSLDGHSLSIMSLAWRDNANGSGSVVSTGSDQLVHVYHFPNPDLTMFERWSPDE